MRATGLVQQGGFACPASRFSGSAAAGVFVGFEVLFGDMPLSFVGRFRLKPLMRVIPIPSLLLALGAALTGCSTFTPVKPASVLREYAVYTTSLEPADSAVMAAQGGVHRVRAHTDTVTSWRFPDGEDFMEQAAERMQLPAGLFADFRRRNRELLCLDASSFPTKARVVVIAEDSPCPGTTPVSVPTPRDSLLTTFSRVGFTSEGEDALTLERFDCGARCGEIGFVHYKRVAGRWKKHRYERIFRF